MFRTIRAAGLAAAVLGFTLLAINGDPIRAGEGEYAPQAHYLDHASAEMTLSADAVNAVEPDPVSEAAGEFVTRAAQLAYAAVPRPRALDELVSAYGRTETQDE
jgi:hypothetical protein